MAKEVSPKVKRAREILRGESATNDSIYDLAIALKGEQAFGYARRLLGRIKKDQISDDKRKRKIGQQRALCTYKDPDLPIDRRLNRGLEILTATDDPRTSTDQETLGLAGAIFKRVWEVDGQKQQLERSLAYYNRGYEEGVENDYGYTAINAAFVSDLLAHLEASEAEQAGARSNIAKLRKENARVIREEIVAKLSPMASGEHWYENEWWFYATIAEAYFGLGKYGEALPWLVKAAKLPNVPKWERESTVRQLAYLAQLHSGQSGQAGPSEASEARVVLKRFIEFIGEKGEAGLRTAFRGKTGLALSGGGFRASLFHIGVLAKLAELDRLREIEVLSCVSGGSIIGAHYYLEVQELLQTKRDDEITPQDYIEIVKRIEKDFLDGVQRNIRMRVAAWPVTNIKMMLLPNYSRTKRAGELYENLLFKKVKRKTRDAQGKITAEELKEPRYMVDLRVRPLTHDGPTDNFKPKYDNWRRDAKVPDLILNATALNTGHNWQFTATWMGEPPAGIDSEIDGNYRLRRLYYEDAPDAYQKDRRKIRLGYAVAASACVPGLFEPLALDGLFGEENGKEKKLVVRLVDGGVHDNQGVASLLEQGCTHLIVSDASGQMGTIDDPSAGVLAVPLRANSILMSRVREAEYNELDARRRSSLLRSLTFVHLKQDLGAGPLDWIKCNDRFEASDEARREEARGDLTSYGIRKDIQQYLALMRTDLDSFSDAEAYALMMSGYAMTARAIPDDMKNAPQAGAAKEAWDFLQIEDATKGGAGYSELSRLLKVSSMRGFKIWKLSLALKIMAFVIGLGAVYGLYRLCLRWWDEPGRLITLGIALALVFAMIIASILIRLIGPPLQRFMHWRKTPSEFAIGALTLLAVPVTFLHLFFFDRLFLRHGRIQCITGKRG
ncbi:MAG: tetratricopeptide repeat-containing protein [Blastocatellia bacterium]